MQGAGRNSGEKRPFGCVLGCVECPPIGDAASEQIRDLI
jgi:hypothetical protein